MTNTDAPKPDQQPKSDDDRRKEQAIETDREKPSTDPIDFSEHDNRLGGDPDVPRRPSQSQTQNGKSQEQGPSDDDD